MVTVNKKPPTPRISSGRISIPGIISKNLFNIHIRGGLGYA